MAVISFLGAGSTIFAKNVLGDCLLAEGLKGSTYRLYDIDENRLADSERMLRNLAAKYSCQAQIMATLNLEEALQGADYVVNAVQIGGYEPCTVTDFEIPKKYGLRQTIGDTLGIGGIFRGLRTIPVVLDFLKTMERVCPHAFFINYVNPMAIVTGAALKASPIKTIGLCHSVQEMLPELLEPIGMDLDGVTAEVYGINHMAWVLSVTKDGQDLYPEIREKCFARETPHDDMVRYELMRRFGYYVTESSEHNAEYSPWFIKSHKPELIEQFNIPLDEYPRRCIKQSAEWNDMRTELLNGDTLEHERSKEYASYIIEALAGGSGPYVFAGNVQNTGLIDNLPSQAIVEVSCVAEKGKITPCHMGTLPVQCAALNQTNINVQLVAIEAALQKKKDLVYQAAMLDPHTAAELSTDEIVSLCDDLIAAHGSWIPSLS
ncbi:MAG: alpha-glucosidase/alpha-galactosidase [Spirochaetales bacterium]|nr:alpha-glucosidase/alpha-galactosidase [Spirochaetales bacterium]